MQTNPTRYFFPDIDASKCSYTSYTTVENGNIIQGKGGGDRSHGIMVGAGGKGNVVSNMNITVYGENAVNIIDLTDAGTGLNQVYNNHLYNNVQTITSRDDFDGCVIRGGDNVYNNTIIGGAQIGIIGHSYTKSGDVHDNKISLNTRFTNDFAIMFWDNSNRSIYNNIIDCVSGNHSCRGIDVTGGSVNGSTKIKVYNNTVLVKELPRNKEYNGCSLGGAYGLYSGNELNTEYYNNNISAFSYTCPSVAFRLLPFNKVTEKYLGVSFSAHDNVFNAYSNGSYSATALLMQDTNTSTAMNFTDNTLNSNYNWINSQSVYGVVFRSTIFNTINSDLSSNPLQGGNQFYTYDASLGSNNIKFIDNSYPDIQTNNIFKNSSFWGFWTMTSHGYDYTAAPYCSYFYSWTLKLNVIDTNNNPIIDANVLIENNNGTLVYFGQTDSSGTISTVLDEFFDIGGNRTYYNNYTITINSAGHNSYNGEINITKTSEITINLDSGDVQGLSSLSSGNSFEQKKISKSDSGIYILNPMVNLINWFRQIFHLSSM